MFPRQKRKQIDILSWAPITLLQLEKIGDVFTATTHWIPFPKLPECSIFSMHPEQQNSFLSINGKEFKIKITMDQIMVGFFFCRKNQCLSSIPWIQDQLITAQQLALTLLMKMAWSVSHA